MDHTVVDIVYVDDVYRVIYIPEVDDLRRWGGWSPADNFDGVVEILDGRPNHDHLIIPIRDGTYRVMYALPVD